MQHSAIFSTKWLVALAFFPLAISYLTFIHIASSPNWDTDYLYLYFSAKRVFMHGDIYYPMHFFSASLNGITQMVNLNPPPLALLMAPFGLMNYTASFWAWSLLNLLLAIFSMLFIVKKLFQPKEKSIYFASIFLLFAYFPMFLNLYAQTGILVFFLTTLGWVAYRENKLQLVGIFLGLAFSIKLFIGLFLWLFFLRKEWRCLTLFLLTAFFVGCISMLVLGPSVYLDYYHVFAKVSWYSASWNASLLGFFSRLFGYLHEKNHAVFYFPQLTIWCYGITVAMLSSTFIFFRKSNKKVALFCDAEQDFAVAYTIAAMLLISPLAWIYYFLLLLIPAAIIFYWNQRVFCQPKVNLFLAVALFFSSIPQLLLKPAQILGYDDVFLWSGCYFYALGILWMLIFKLNQSLKKNLSRVDSETEKNYFSVNQFCKDAINMPLLVVFGAALLPSFLSILTMASFISAGR